MSRHVVPLWLVALAVFTFLIAPVSASEKTFLRLDRVCFADPDHGRVWLSARGPEYYFEVIGNTTAAPMKVCQRNLLVLRSCRRINTYNFSIACRGGRVSAPEFYVAYFAHDSIKRDLDPRVSGNQLSIVQSRYLINNPIGPTPEPKRFYYPAGYAPMHRDAVEDILVRIPWDDGRRRPHVDFPLTPEQEERLASMFRMRGGVVEPFPATHMAQLVEWRAVATAVLPLLAGLPYLAQIIVIAGIFGVGAALNWLASRPLGKTAIAQRAVVFALISMASYLLVYWLGIPDGVTLIAINIAGGFFGLVVGLFL